MGAQPSLGPGWGGIVWMGSRGPDLQQLPCSVLRSLKTVGSLQVQSAKEEHFCS